MFQAFGLQGSFGFYAGFNIVAPMAIFLFLPEAKERTLEELDYVFDIVHSPACQVSSHTGPAPVDQEMGLHDQGRCFFATLS